jgi:hypothetical protein
MIPREKPDIRVMDSSGDDFIEPEFESIGQILPDLEKSSVTWINTDGLHDFKIMTN